VKSKEARKIKFINTVEIRPVSNGEENFRTPSKDKHLIFNFPQKNKFYENIPSTNFSLCSSVNEHKVEDDTKKTTLKCRERLPKMKDEVTCRNETTANKIETATAKKESSFCE
jgi:hypothetical protein